MSGVSVSGKQLETPTGQDLIQCSALRDASTASESSTLERLWSRAATPVSINRQKLCVHRSTAWTIIKATHKLGRLSRKTTVRILTNPNTPQSVRAVIQQYLAERSIGSAKELMWANSDDPLQRDRLS